MSNKRAPGRSLDEWMELVTPEEPFKELIERKIMEPLDPTKGLPRIDGLYAVEDALYRTDKHTAGLPVIATYYHKSNYLSLTTILTHRVLPYVSLHSSSRQIATIASASG